MPFIPPPLGPVEAGMQGTEGSRPVGVPHRPLGNLGPHCKPEEGRTDEQRNELLRGGGDAPEGGKGIRSHCRSKSHSETDRRQLS